MARPTKEEKKKRENIINLELYKRDSFLYTRFEERAENISSSHITSYIFCSECNKRDYMDIELKDFKKDEISYRKDKSITNKIKELYDIDKFMAFYTLNLYLVDHFKGISSKNYKLYSIQNINLQLEEHEKYSQPNQVKLIHKNYTPYNPFRLIDTPENAFNLDDIQRVNKVFAELDLSKPLNELIEFVTIIKKEYEENPYNIYENDFKAHKCELPNCDIYKAKSPKPIYGRLADVLFVYDCKKMGLNEDYIKKEIDRYWIDIKNLFKDNFTSSTLSNYYKFSQKYINEREYQSFICGYDISRK